MTRTYVPILVASLALAAAGCSCATSPAGNDAGSTIDAASLPDAQPLADTGADAAGAVDTGTDATVDDGGTDAATDVDAGIDCSTIGCGAPPICGTACDAPCGCCPCGEGTEMGTYICQGGCWAPRGTGASGDPCSTTTDCGSGLSCCYPCGIPGCTNQCTPSCTAGDPGCSGGCFLIP